MTKRKSMNEEIPRYRISIQDGITEIQISAGADDIDLFTKTDLLKFVAHFNKQVKIAESTAIPPKEAIEAEIVKRSKK